MLRRQTAPQVTGKKELRDEGLLPSQPTCPDGHSTRRNLGKLSLRSCPSALWKLDRHQSKCSPGAGFALLYVTASHQPQLWDGLPGKPRSVCRRGEKGWLQVADI